MIDERGSCSATATHVAAFLLSDHQPTQTGLCTCGQRLRADLAENDSMAEHQAEILMDSGALGE